MANTRSGAWKETTLRALAPHGRKLNRKTKKRLSLGTVILSPRTAFFFWNRGLMRCSHARLTSPYMSTVDALEATQAAEAPCMLQFLRAVSACARHSSREQPTVAPYTAARGVRASRGGAIRTGVELTAATQPGTSGAACHANLAQAACAAQAAQHSDLQQGRGTRAACSDRAGVCAFVHKDTDSAITRGFRVKSALGL